MLTFSSEQFDRLTVYQREDFVRQTVALLHREAPDYLALCDNAAAEAHVDADIDRATAYGFVRGCDVRAFIALRVLGGSVFPDHAWFAPVDRILSNRHVDTATRLRRAGETLTALVRDGLGVTS